MDDTNALFYGRFQKYKFLHNFTKDYQRFIRSNQISLRDWAIAASEVATPMKPILVAPALVWRR